MKRTLLLIPGVLYAAMLGGCLHDNGFKATKPAVTGKVTVEEVRFSAYASKQRVVPLQRKKPLPASVTAQMPSGGVSEFFGVCKGLLKYAKGVESNSLLVHLYLVPGGKKSDEYNEIPYIHHSVFLDLFTFTNPKKPAQLRHLNRVDLTQPMKCLNGNWARGSDSVSQVDLMWVDLRQQIPVLRIQMSGTALSGIAGCYGLVAFPEGLKGKTVIQDFETYDNITGGMDVFFNDRDKRGFLVVRQEARSYDMDFDKQKTTAKQYPKTYFGWNGKGFVVRKSTSPAVVSP